MCLCFGTSSGSWTTSRRDFGIEVCFATEFKVLSSGFEPFCGFDSFEVAGWEVLRFLWRGWMASAFDIRASMAAKSSRK